MNTRIEEIIYESINHSNFTAQIADKEEIIDKICKFRANSFIECGIYSADTKSDKDQFDINPNTSLVYVERDGNILATVRATKKQDSCYKLPIEDWFFKHNGRNYKLDEMLEKKFLSLDAGVGKIESQISGLAIDKKYRKNFAFRKGLKICSSMFSSLLNVFYDKEINNAIIGSAPCATKIYELFGAKKIYEGSFKMSEFSTDYLPVNIMNITRDSWPFHSHS